MMRVVAFIGIILLMIGLAGSAQTPTKGEWDYTCYQSMDALVNYLNLMKPELVITAKVVTYNNAFCVIYRR